MSYLESLVQIYDIEKPLLVWPTRASALADGLRFAVRRTTDMAALRRAIIRKLEEGVARQVMPSGRLSGILDRSVDTTIAEADWSDHEQTLLGYGYIQPIQAMPDGRLCLLGAIFWWRSLPVSDTQALAIMRLLADNDRLRCNQRPPVQSTDPRAAADQAVCHAIGGRSRQPLGLITRHADQHTRLFT